MPRNRLDIATYRRHRASGQAVVTLNGVDHYLGRYGTPESKAQYDRVIKEWLVRGRRIGDGDGSADPPVKELIGGLEKEGQAPRPDGFNFACFRCGRPALAILKIEAAIGETRLKISREAGEAGICAPCIM